MTKKRYIGDDHPGYRMLKCMKMKLTMRVANCPFCASQTAVLMPHGKDLWYIICDALNGGCGASTGRRKKALEVIDLWNTRNGLRLFEQEDHVKKFLKTGKVKK
jgi:hypothetical protein